MIASISRWSNMTTAEYWELREQRLMLELAQADANLAGHEHMRIQDLSVELSRVSQAIA